MAYRLQFNSDMNQIIDEETLARIHGGGSGWYQRYLDGARYADEVVAPRTGIRLNSPEGAANRRMWGVSNMLFPKWLEADRASAPKR